MTRTIFPLVAAFAMSGCAARERPRSQPTSSALPTASSADAAAPLRQALQRAITGHAGRDSLHLFVDCRTGDAMTSVKVFGSGIGIWNDERQFRLDPSQIGSLLRALQAADFPGMEDTYGGATGLPRPRPAPSGGGDMVTIVTCRVELGVAGYDKAVVQLAQGEQSPTLKKLAEDLVGVCKPPARDGLAATSLRDGLEKVSREELAPETWLVVVHRKPRETGGHSGHSGFLLRVSGYQAATRAYDPAKGYRDPVLLQLAAKEVGSLAGELALRDPASWPINLYADDYTDLTIQVLNHEKSVQARQFAGLAPAAQGQYQTAFEEVIEILERLHRRVLDQGRPVATDSAP
jgi:hypothetical protein